MCGIIGYVGKENAAPILIEGLKRLEYRGYDSVGIAVLSNSTVLTLKTKGRIADLKRKLEESGFPQGNLGLGHTRWATHGEPSEVNSHPHTCGKVTLVHNGIIENYAELKARLAGEGRSFVSGTDTEIVAHLIDRYYSGDPAPAIFRAVSELRGSYALGIFFSDIPGRLFAIRKESPLVVGVGKEGNYISSDIPALLLFTNRYYLLEPGELAVVSEGGVSFLDSGLKPVSKKLLTVDWDVSKAEKGGYPSFMLKEIFEQPRALADTIHPQLAKGIRGIFSEEIKDLSFLKRLYITACGSALHAGMVGRHFLERLGRIPVHLEVASEFRHQVPVFREGDGVIIISQSGETADTIAALKRVKESKVPTIAVINVVGSTIAREADTVLYTRAGPEIAVATTKAYSAQIAVLLLLALRLASERRTCPSSEIEKYVKALAELPEAVERTLEKHEHIRNLAARYKDSEHFFFIGRGVDAALCSEASLKLKEITYIHSEAYPAGEMKHGTISLIEPGRPVAALATGDELFEKTMGNVEEVKARGARVLLVTREGRELKQGICDDLITVPAVAEFVRPLATIVPLQLFAYYIAEARGLDIDKPRNLAKSVTVE